MRLLRLVLESKFLSEMVTLIPSGDSCVRLLLDSRLHHVITGVLTPSASQVNTAGLGDTTVVSMGGTLMVAGTGVVRKVVQTWIMWLRNELVCRNSNLLQHKLNLP